MTTTPPVRDFAAYCGGLCPAVHGAVDLPAIARRFGLLIDSRGRAIQHAAGRIVAWSDQPDTLAITGTGQRGSLAAIRRLGGNVVHSSPAGFTVTFPSGSLGIVLAAIESVSVPAPASH